MQLEAFYPIVDILHPYYAYNLDEFKWELFPGLKLRRKHLLLQCCALMFYCREKISDVFLKHELNKIYRYLEAKGFVPVNTINEFNEILTTIDALIDNYVFIIRNYKLEVVTIEHLYKLETIDDVRKHLVYASKQFFKVKTALYKPLILDLKLKYGIDNTVIFGNLYNNSLKQMIYVTNDPHIFKMKINNAEVVAFDWKSYLLKGGM